MKFRLLCRIAAGMSILWVVFANAQDTASLTGTVRDSTGASIANAQVTLTSPERGITRETTTNSDGDYSVPALTPGSYDVLVTAQGFKKYEAKGVILRVAQKARNDVNMQVGASNIE